MQKPNSTKKITRRGPSNEFIDKRRASVAAAGFALMLLTGFFFAGQQHFSSMDYGIRNSRLRKQLDDLRAEKQRLLFTREVSLAPNEIKKAAKKIGIHDRNVGGNSSPAPELASVRRNKDLRRPSELNSKPTIIKTAAAVSVAPKIQKTVDVIARNQKPERASAAR